VKIAIMGSGGVGGYFGARLAAAGEDVHFIARGAHLAAMNERGLRVESANGDLMIRPVKATAEPADIGPVDVVMFCVKLWDTGSAAERIGPLVGDGTGVVSFQNGVHAEERLAAMLGAEHVMGGIAQILAAIGEPGVIVHTGATARLEFGELDGRQSGRAAALLAACERAGIDAAIPDDVNAAIWRKFIFITTFSAATCLARSPLGPIRADEAGRELIEALLGEAAAVARAKGIAIAEDLEAQLMGVLDSWPDQATTSMQADLERGNRLEVDWLSGAVARLGAEVGVDTPAHRTAWQALRLHAAGGGRR
jgi:2-dehydropantoate 2-reductase